MHKHLLLQCYVRPVDNASHVMPQTALAGHNLRPAPFVAVLVMRGPPAAAMEALRVRVPQPESPAHAVPTLERCPEGSGPASDSASTFGLSGAMLLDKDRLGIPYRSGWMKEQPLWMQKVLRDGKSVLVYYGSTGKVRAAIRSNRL